MQVHASDSKASLSTDSETKIKAKPRIERNRVLVTGGAGFVGSHLCTYLVERGDHVSSPISCQLSSVWSKNKQRFFELGNRPLPS